MIFVFVAYQGKFEVTQAFASLGGVMQDGFAVGTYCLVLKAVGSAYSWEVFVREELQQEKYTYGVINKTVEEMNMWSRRNMRVRAHTGNVPTQAG